MFRGKLDEGGVDVLLTIFDDALTSESLRLATELRARKLRVEVYPESLKGGKNLGKAFKYADSRKARFVTVVGQDELQRGDVKIKNMKTGEQMSVSRASVASVLVDGVDLPPRGSDVDPAPRTSHLAPRTSEPE
jgi:histidyl-tRNA synthetase